MLFWLSISSPFSHSLFLFFFFFQKPINVDKYNLDLWNDWVRFFDNPYKIYCDPPFGNHRSNRVLLSMCTRLFLKIFCGVWALVHIQCKVFKLLPIWTVSRLTTLTVDGLRKKYSSVSISTNMSLWSFVFLQLTLMHLYFVCNLTLNTIHLE